MIYVSGPTKSASDTSDIVFQFIDFNKITEIINIEDLTLKYLDEDEEFCNNNHFLFEIMFSNPESRPLQSTICKVSLSNDKEHTEANCAIPISGNKIKCFVDVSQKNYVKNNKIIINEKNLIPCKNGQYIKISLDSQIELEIKEECGEIIIKNKYFFNIIFFILFFIF